jgi:hypothetical protein
MSEVSRNHPAFQASEYSGPPLEVPTLLEFEREQLLLEMVEKGLLSEEFYTSGAADKFAIDEETQQDAIRHILIGDMNGGAHHLPTLVELEAGRNVTVASMLPRPEPIKNLGLLRYQQGIRDNGTFRAKDVRIADDDGYVLRKSRGSIMFPNDWTTQHVLESVLRVSSNPAKNSGELYRHTATVDDVKITVLTDPETSKIVSAFPG